MFFSPKAHPVVNDTLGVAFPTPYRFERSFADVLTRIFGDTWNEPDPQTLTDDLSATLRETPTIGAAFANPIPEAVAVHETESDNLDLARRAFEDWKPEGVSRLGLPRLGDADFHALDFAMWCAARIALSDERKAQVGRGQVPPEVGMYPAIFARILGATGAGFEALMALVAAYPGLASYAMSELLDPVDVGDQGLPAVVELYDSVLRLVAQTDGRDSDIPFGAVSQFFRANRVRLSEDQKLTLFRLFEATARGPYPGGPLDLLGEFAVERTLREEVMQRVGHWAKQGLFDKVDSARRSEAPSQFYGFVRELFKREMAEEANVLLETVAYPHIRRLFRSHNSHEVVKALRWIARADQLPPANRWIIARAFEDGVYSSEFEDWEHAVAVTPAAAQVAGYLRRDESIDSSALSRLNRVLREAGLSEV